VNSRRSWLIFAVATAAYLVGVLQRTSLGVAGVEATDRFGISAAALSSLAVVQLIVYAALQIPVGILLDRIGPRALILTGALLMFAGQTTLALAPSLWVALIGRILVGAGDAMTFISVLRLFGNWFAGRTLPIVSQWVGTTGQIGQLLSAIPLAILIHQSGWTTAFLAAGSASLIAAIAVAIFVRNRPAGAMLTGPIETMGGSSKNSAFAQLKEALSRPGTRLGFWSHFVTQSSGTVLTLLWGFPFFSVALGYGPATAAGLITLMVIAGAVTGPILGLLSARYPLRRSSIVLAIVAGMAVAWAIVLLWPGQPPFWTVILLLIIVSAGGPGSLIGFDFARTFNPRRNLGSATGIVNVGGFLASFVMMFLIGVLLDAIHSANVASGSSDVLYSLAAFKVAFVVQYLVVGIGVGFLIRARRQTRRRLHEQEGIQVAPLWVALMRRWRKRQ
jgi:sugar phosphate permease